MDIKSSLRTLPLLWLSIIFLVGVVLASLLSAALWIWVVLAILVAAVGFGLRKRTSEFQLFSLTAICILLFGAARYQVAQPNFDSDDLATYNDSANLVEITGTLEKPAAPRDGYVELIVRAEKLRLPDNNELSVDGFVLARTDLGVDWNYGDQIRISGELTTPAEYEDFSYRDYLARQGVYSLVPFAAVERLETGRGNPFWAIMYGVRERGLETLYRLYPAREAALLAGILLGDESGLSEQVKTDFNDTGTRHIIAISGFNISIIAGLLLAASSRWLGARRGAWIAGIGIGLYTLLVGADAPVVRAAIMGILVLIALRTGRQTLALNSLGFSAAVMALINPLVLWDIGFQLSFAATLGLVLYSEPMNLWVQRWLETHVRLDWAKKLSRPFNDYALMTVAAQITTLPILLFYFHRLSIFSLPANLFILPVQPALMVLGGLSVLAGMVLLPLGQFIAYFAWALAAYTLRIVEFIAALPWASQSFSFPIYLVIAWFAALAVISIPGLRERFKNMQLIRVGGLIGLAAFVLWSWNAALAAPDGKLHLTLLDVDGEALLIRTPGGETYLSMREVHPINYWTRFLD